MFVRLRVHAALVCAPTSRGRISDGNEKVAAGTKRAFFSFFARGFVLNASCECLRVKKKRDIVLFLFVVFFNVINEMSLLCCAAVELARDFFYSLFFSSSLSSLSCCPYFKTISATSFAIRTFYFCCFLMNATEGSNATFSIPPSLFLGVGVLWY